MTTLAYNQSPAGTSSAPDYRYQQAKLRIVDRAPSRSEAQVSTIAVAASSESGVLVKRKSLKKVAWASFIAMMTVACVIVIAMFVNAYWLALLMLPALIATYGLLFSLGMHISELDRSRLRIVIRD